MGAFYLFLLQAYHSASNFPHSFLFCISGRYLHKLKLKNYLYYQLNNENAFPASLASHIAQNKKKK